MWWLALLAFADWSAIERQVTAGRYREALAQLELERERPARWHVLASKAYDGLNDPARAVAEAEAALQHRSAQRSGARAAWIYFPQPEHARSRCGDLHRRGAAFSAVARRAAGKGLALKELQRYDEAEKT